MTTKYVQCQNPKLKVAIGPSDTSAVFTEFVDLNGDPITQTDFGTVGYGTLAPNTSQEEAVSFVITANTTGEATLTLTRGLLGKAPYGTGGPTYTHQAQTELVISNNPDLLNKLTAKDNDETVTGSWQFPETPTHNQNPVTKAHFDDNAVQLTGDQTVAGVKTFSSSPVIPDATDDDEAASKGQTEAYADALDAENVKLTGDQTVAGVKTFSSSPVVPDATAANHPYTKGQHDADATAFSAVASPTVRGTAKLDTAADDALDPEVLTATADRVAALAGGGDFGTPSNTNKFTTEEYLNNSYIAPQVVVFTSSGTWTKDPGLKYVVVEGVGGGGGADTDFDDEQGGGGGYFRKLIPAVDLGSTETVTVGAAGSNSTTTPTAGGSTSFGSHCTANGGASNGTGGTATGGDINIQGQAGKNGSTGTGGNYAISGSSILGLGGMGSEGPTGYGSGGNYANSGKPGIVIVTEYYS